MPRRRLRRPQVGSCPVKENKTHRDFIHGKEGVLLAVAHPWASASSYLSSQSLARRFSLQPSCHLAVVPLSSFSPVFCCRFLGDKLIKIF